MINDKDNLRQQLIEAMAERLGLNLATSVFDHDLWPALDAAMKAGELLVAKRAVEQKPVHEAITAWLEVVGWTVKRIRAEQATTSKAEILKYIYDLDDNCQRALAEAKSLNERKELSFTNDINDRAKLSH